MDEGTLALTCTPSPGPIGCDLATYGPQTFHPAIVGSERIDPCLESRNMDIEKGLLDAAESYYKQEDFRWFFAFAHGKITQQINNNLGAFQRPNALIRLNIHFAEEFLRAIDGLPHQAWKRAFRVCQSLQNASQNTAILVGELELCGAAMANVHIHVDLAAAIREVGCIPPDDYSNMLVFVNRGALAAVVRLRGIVLGSLETVFQRFAEPIVKLEVKAWRNAVYEGACYMMVPEVGQDFVKRIKL
jgi:hypothetical protein